MKILVLGGNGFIGSHVVDQLLASGHQVRVFDRSTEKYRQPLNSVEYVYGDFGGVPLIVEALQGVDVVCHFVSTTVPATSNLDPVADVQSNLVNSLMLLEQMRKNDVKRIVFLSGGDSPRD